jgi:hypothetical protein
MAVLAALAALDQNFNKKYFLEIHTKEETRKFVFHHRLYRSEILKYLKRTNEQFGYEIIY